MHFLVYHGIFTCRVPMQHPTQCLIVLITAAVRMMMGAYALQMSTEGRAVSSGKGWVGRGCSSAVACSMHGPWRDCLLLTCMRSLLRHPYMYSC